MSRMANTAAWKRLRQQAFNRDGHECVCCGTHEQLECDHVIARADGGTDELDNVRTLCRSCHQQRTRVQARLRAHRKRRRRPAAPTGGFFSPIATAHASAELFSLPDGGVQTQVWFPEGEL